MRLAFLVLLLANLLLYFWGQDYLGAESEGREPGRMDRQIEPEKLRILPGGELARIAVAAAAPTAACKRIEWLSDSEAAAIRGSLEALPGWELSLTPRKEDPAYRVVIPKLATRALANSRKAELRQQGVKGAEVVEDATLGPYAILLGEFRSRQPAEELLQSLGQKGGRTAQIVRREMAAEKFSLELRAPADVLGSKLPDLILALPQAQLLDCAAP